MDDLIQIKAQIDKYRDVVDIVEDHIIGSFYLVTLEAKTYLKLLFDAKLIPLPWCPRCGSDKIVKKGYTTKLKQRYLCVKCGKTKA